MEYDLSSISKINKKSFEVEDELSVDIINKSHHATRELVELGFNNPKYTREELDKDLKYWLRQNPDIFNAYKKEVERFNTKKPIIIRTLKKCAKTYDIMKTKYPNVMFCENCLSSDFTMFHNPYSRGIKKKSLHHNIFISKNNTGSRSCKMIIDGYKELDKETCEKIVAFEKQLPVYRKYGGVWLEVNDKYTIYEEKILKNREEQMKDNTNGVALSIRGDELNAHYIFNYKNFTNLKQIYIAKLETLKKFNNDFDEIIKTVDKSYAVRKNKGMEL